MRNYGVVWLRSSETYGCIATIDAGKFMHNIIN